MAVPPMKAVHAEDMDYYYTVHPNDIRIIDSFLAQVSI